MKYLELVDKRANLWEETKNFLDTHTDKDGKISAADAATYDRMEKDVAELSKQIERYQRQAAMDKHLAQPDGQPILNNPQNNGEVKTGRASAGYKDALLSAIRSNFKNVNNILQESTDVKGGYLVPAEWDERLIEALEEENVMRQLGTNITTSGEHKINVSQNGPAANWVSEGGNLPFSDSTFDQKTLDAYKLAVGARVTNELLADNAYNLEDHLIRQFTKAIGNAEEDAFINGSGTGRPKGFLTTLAADTDSTITTAGANISADDILNTVYKLERPYRRNAAFLLNDSTLAAIRKLKDANQAYMWQPSYQAGEPDRLLGYPVYSSAYMPTIASGNSVLAFGDFSYYNIGDRGVRVFRQLVEKFADTDETGFLMLERVDGVLLLNEAIKILQIK